MGMNTMFIARHSMALTKLACESATAFVAKAKNQGHSKEELLRVGSDPQVLREYAREAIREEDGKEAFEEADKYIDHHSTVREIYLSAWVACASTLLKNALPERVPTWKILFFKPLRQHRATGRDATKHGIASVKSMLGPSLTKKP